jgi:hypothetical protein
MKRQVLKLTVLLLLACSLLLGCGDSGSDKTGQGEEGKPVDEAQALVLAQLLQRNWQEGGATFRATMPIQGTPVVAKGRIDFRNGRGQATLRDPSGQTRQYLWTPKMVYAQSAPKSRRYERERPNPDGNPVHQMIAFLNLLSAETVDNTVNIVDQGARYLGREEIAGATVDRYRYGGDGRTTYWVGVEDGLLHRVQAELPQGRLEVDLGERGKQLIKIPGSQ